MSTAPRSLRSIRRRTPQNPGLRSDVLIEQLLTDHPVILAREHRELRNALAQATETGWLARLLPGVYVDADRRTELATRVASVGCWDPSAVVCGRAAAPA
ncbi:MAG: hypothetical protein L0H41_10820 [Microlunatus sp.]|nr:hypothetical protein [Microlunatus sp.]MDN5771596.1 hypothetical protein [Microlunatus sp.]